MAVTFTPEQQRVIDTRDRNILVSAAAGSGKTAVLVERIIQKICDAARPVDIDRLLIVTFTSAAAAQMRERISNAVMKKLEEEPDNEHIQKQATLIHNAQITTIDSFCLFIIRNNFNAIGLDPGFRVADEGEIKLTEADVLKKLLEDEFAQGRERFLHFVECYSTGAGEQKIEEAILRLYHFSTSYPFPEDWLRQREQDYQADSVEDMDKKPWFLQALQYMDTVLQECKAQLVKAVQIAESAGGPNQYLENLEADLELVEKLGIHRGYQKIYEAFADLSFTTLSRKKGEGVDPGLKDVVKSIRDEVKKTIGDLKKLLFQISPEHVWQDMQACHEVVLELVSLTLDFKGRLDQTKREKNLLDFSDMEHFALQILLEKDDENNLKLRETALELQDYFEEIMIDEYQDSNEVQELLLKSISGEQKGIYNRFMVGDVKQSIYKFRLARPEIFMEKYETYEAGAQAKEKMRIDLSRNFRSRSEVTDATNFICGQIMKKEVGNVEYDTAAALYAGATYPQSEQENCYQTELWIATPSEDTQESFTSKELEAYMVAERIQELVGSFPITDAETGELRPAKYSDIVILFRATTGWDEEFRKVLSEKGIPVHTTSRTGYFQTLEIQEMVNFLRVLDNPLQDICFFGMMKLPYFAFTEEEIALVQCYAKALLQRDEEAEDNRTQETAEEIQKQEPRELYFYEKMQLFMKSQEQKEAPMLEELLTDETRQELARKVKKLLETIEKYREKVAYTPIKELIHEILQDTGFGAYVGAMPDGEQRRANIELLLEKAGAFEKTSYYGLFHFVRYLETMQEQEVDFGEANILDENADVVRIMTIHKSKGLEFPICFVCGLSKQFNQMDTRQGILMDVEMGIGVDYIDPKLRVKRKTLRKNIVAQRMKQDTRGEDLRVLYVALTRAKEKLILTGYQEDMEKKLKNNLQLILEKEEKLPYSVMMSASSYFDLILAACMRHQGIEDMLIACGLPYEVHTLPYGEVPIQISLWQQKDSVLEEIRETGRAEMLEETLCQAEQYQEESLGRTLQDRLEYQYPYQYLEGLTVKTTVSELKKASYEEEQEPSAELFVREREPYLPSFAREEQKLLGTQYGTAVHKVMELLPFSEELLSGKGTEAGKPSLSLIKDMMQGWIDTGLVQKDMIACVKAESIVNFLQSPLAKRMIQANQLGMLYKEQPFVLGISASRLKAQYPESETVLIQGVIDVFFYEGKEIVLADYKTDRVSKPEELANRYGIQLDYYQQALEQITGKKVKERLLYSFALQQEIRV